MQRERPIGDLPSLVSEEDDAELELTAGRTVAPGAPISSVKSERRPYLLRLTGPRVGFAHPLGKTDVILGRLSSCEVLIDDQGVSRRHARITQLPDGRFAVVDLGSSNGTLVNGTPVTEQVTLTPGDQIQIGTESILKFVFVDEVEERFQRFTHQAITLTDVSTVEMADPTPWSPSSWRTKPVGQEIVYEDRAHLERVLARLRRLPPLVTSGEVEELKAAIAEAQQGRRFLLQGGDCAETHEECESEIITNKLKIVLQMSLVLIRGLRRPVIRIGRLAGQYGKPRSKPTETRNGVELPSYFGDLINGPAFDAAARKPDPERLLTSYFHSALTLNFIRSLASVGFADLRRPEYFDLAFTQAEPTTELRGDYREVCRELTESLHLFRSIGDRPVDDLLRVNFYASHEGLNLHYEEAQTRLPPRRDAHYDLTTHMPWIGERTRALNGAHIEFFRGIANPVGVKIGPSTTREELIDTCRALNPSNAWGKLVIITRMGAKNVAERLPPLVTAIRRAGIRVLWVCDPMHGNAITTPRANIKTRDFEDILREVELSVRVHRDAGTYLGGVHFELTGEDVTECIGGGLTEDDLTRRYATFCDPRLNYRQALQMAFLISDEVGKQPRPASVAPPPPSRR